MELKYLINCRNLARKYLACHELSFESEVRLEQS